MTMRGLPLAASVLIASQVYAADSSSDDTLQEIVVTAQRRAERLQDVPASITALSGDALNQEHLQGNADLARQVPSLSLNVLGPGESLLAIRGLGTAYGLAPAVSYYVNETPLDIRTDGYAGAPDIDFFDIDRIEVLRGPQGTLYGSSSMGGALRILTAQPDPNNFVFKAEVGGSTMDRGGTGYLAKSAVNLPLSDTAAIRVVGTYEHIPGYINRELPPGDYSVASPNEPVTGRRVNDADTKSGRIMGLWRVTDDLSITPSLMISEVDAASTSQYFTNLPQFTTSGYYPTPQQARLEVGNFKLDYNFGFASLLSSTSVLSRDVDNDSDFTLLWANLAPAFGLPYPPNYPGLDLATSHNMGFTQEFRLTSPTDQALRWVGGVYFSHYRQHSTEVTKNASVAEAIGQTNTDVLYTFDQGVVDQQSAVFADLTYKIIPSFEVTAGARYYELHDSLENTQTGVLAAPSQPLSHAHASGTSPRGVLTYHPTDDATLYATAARGYRPGGPNIGLPQGIGCSLGSAYSPFYDPDSVWNHELGLKTEFLQRRLSIDVAAYRIDWQHVQQSVSDPGCGYNFVANVGSAQSKGVEAEINFKPLESLLLSASGSYTHAEFKSIAGPFVGASTAKPGDDLPDIPRQKYALGGEYTAKLSASQTGYVHTDWSHLGSVPTGFTFHAVRPAYNSLNGSIGVRTDHYDISLYGHNLTNSNGILYIQEATGMSYGDVFRTQISTPPRVIGVDLKVNF